MHKVNIPNQQQKFLFRHTETFSDFTTTDKYFRKLGQKMYELSNHLGNVNAVISDVRIGVDDFAWTGSTYASGSDGFADYYRPKVVSATDYYPFGWTLPNRSFNSGDYRFGFQGQETDREYLGGAIFFKYRVHDPRVGRFLSVDPLAPKYPFYSPYSFSGNRVNDAVELEGLEPAYLNKNGNVTLASDNLENGYPLEQVSTTAGPDTDPVTITFLLAKSAVEGTIDGVAYASSSVVVAIVGGYSYGLAETFGYSGTENMVELPKVGFSFGNKYWFATEKANMSDVSFEDGTRIMGGTFTILTIGIAPKGVAAKSGKFETGTFIPGLADDLPSYLYHYTDDVAANSITKVGLKTQYSSDGFLYLTNKGGLSPLQAQIELALPANRSLPTAILRVDVTNLQPILVRQVQGNLPGMGAGGGTEFLFNQNIPAHLIQQVK